MGFFKHFFKEVSKVKNEVVHDVSQDASHLAKQVEKVAAKLATDVIDADMWVLLAPLLVGMKVILKKKGISTGSDPEKIARDFAEHVIGLGPHNFESLAAYRAAPRSPVRVPGPGGGGGGFVGFNASHGTYAQPSAAAAKPFTPLGIPTQAQQQIQQNTLLTNLSNQAQAPLGGGGGGGGYSGDMSDPGQGYPTDAPGWGQTDDTPDDQVIPDDNIPDDDSDQAANWGQGQGNFESINQKPSHHKKHHHHINPGANFESISQGEDVAESAAAGAIGAVVPGAGALPIKQIIQMIVGWFKGKHNDDKAALAALAAAGKAAFLTTPAGKQYKAQIIRKDVEIGLGIAVVLGLASFGIYEGTK